MFNLQSRQPVLQRDFNIVQRRFAGKSSAADLQRDLVSDIEFLESNHQIVKVAQLFAVQTKNQVARLNSSNGGRRAFLDIADENTDGSAKSRFILHSETNPSALCNSCVSKVTLQHCRFLNRKRMAVDQVYRNQSRLSQEGKSSVVSVGKFSLTRLI